MNRNKYAATTLFYKGADPTVNDENGDGIFDFNYKWEPDELENMIVNTPSVIPDMYKKHGIPANLMELHHEIISTYLSANNNGF